MVRWSPSDSKLHQETSAHLHCGTRCGLKLGRSVATLRHRRHQRPRPRPRLLDADGSLDEEGGGRSSNDDGGTASTSTPSSADTIVGVVLPLLLVIAGKNCCVRESGRQRALTRGKQAVYIAGMQDGDYSCDPTRGLRVFMCWANEHV